MNYVIQLNGKEKIGTVPEPDELEVLIKAALSSVRQYECYDVEVKKVDPEYPLDYAEKVAPETPSWIRDKIKKIT
jgi:hypothetical protein